MDTQDNNTEKQRRQRYLIKAMELYGSQPFESVTAELIAQRLGLSESEFSELFPSIESLYFEGVQMVKDDVLSIMNFPQDMNFEQGLAIVVRDFITYVAERPKLFQVLLSSSFRFEDRSNVQSLVNATRDEIVKRISEKMGLPGNIPLVRLLIHGSIGFVEATTLTWIEKKDIHLEQVIQLVIGALKTSLVPLGNMLPKSS